MKARAGFVSNSSSTSFTFVFRGGTMDALEAAIKAHARRFDLSIEYWSDDSPRRTDAADVALHIRECLGSVPRGRAEEWENRHGSPVSIVSLSAWVKEERADRMRHVRWLREAIAEKGGDRGYESWLRAADKEALRLRRIIRRARKAGLDSALEIKFGDNEGHVCGNDGDAAGYCLDAERDGLWIQEDDLVVIPENCH